MTDDRPINEIFGAQDWQTGRYVETGRRQVEVIAYADDVRIGLVGKDYRILVSAVSIVRLPGGLREEG